jgi:hypothetical protein
VEVITTAPPKQIGVTGGTNLLKRKSRDGKVTQMARQGDWEAESSGSFMTIAEWAAPLTRKTVRSTQITHKNFVTRHKQPGLDLKVAGGKNKSMQSIIRAAAEKVTLLQESQLKMQKIIEDTIGNRSLQTDLNFITPPKISSFRAPSITLDSSGKDESTPNTARGIEMVNNLLARTSVIDSEKSKDQPLGLTTGDGQESHNDNSVNNLLARTSVNDPETSTDQLLGLMTGDGQESHNDNSVNNRLARTSVNDPETSTEQPLGPMTGDGKESYNNNNGQTASKASPEIISTSVQVRATIMDSHESETLPMGVLMHRTNRVMIEIRKSMEMR